MTDPTAFARKVIHKYGSVRPGRLDGLVGGEPRRHHEGTLPRALQHWQAFSTQGGQVNLQSLGGLVPGVGEGYNLLMELIEAITRTPEEDRLERWKESVDEALVDWRQKYLALVNGPEGDDVRYAAALKYALAICDSFHLDDRGLRQWADVAANA